MTQLVTFGDTALRLTPPGRERLKTAHELRTWADGTESNVAIAASRLGVPTIWLSKLPDSELGKRVVAELREHGLQTDVVWTDAEAHRLALTFHEPSVDPRQEVRLQDRENVAAATAVPRDLSMGLIKGAKAFFVAGSTYALSETTQSTVRDLYRAAEGKRVFDLDYRSIPWDPAETREALGDLLGEVDVFVGRERDVRTVLNKSGKPREIVHSLAAQGDFELVVVTREEHGAIAYEDNVIHEQAAVETDTVDPAGDHEAFVGAFVRKLIEERPIEEGLAYGAAAAALTRTMPGPIPAFSGAEVEALVDEVGTEGRNGGRSAGGGRGGSGRSSSGRSSSGGGHSGGGPRR